MKAAFYKGNGTFEIAENVPVNPGEGKVMLNVAFRGICGTDVHIFHGGETKKNDLFKFFWSEIEMLGARLNESDDYEEAIRIAASGSVPLDTLITRFSNLSNIQNVFEEID